MEMPHVYTVQFNMDIETPPLDIISQIELATQPKAIFQLQAYLPNIFACSTMSESAFKKLCENGFTSKQGEKVSVIPNLRSVRGVLMQVRAKIRERVVVRKLKKYGTVLLSSLKCVKDPEDPDYNIWGFVIVLNKPISRFISVGGFNAFAVMQKSC